MSLITLRGITRAFAGTLALDGVDVDLHPGEIHALVGENGSGKSTLLRIVSGVHRPTSGTLTVDGAERDYHRPADATADGIVLVTQEGSLVPDLSVTENIFVGRLSKRAGRVDWRGMHRHAGELLDTLGVDVDPQRTTRTLPPDQRQLVEIARALSYDSRVLLLDEPTSALDPHETERLLATVRGLSDGRGMSVVLVSHRMPEIMSVCDRFTVLRDGRLIGSRTRHETDEGWLVRAMVGRDLHRVSIGEAPERNPTDQPILEVRDLCDRNGRLSDISLTVRPGEVVGLAGIVGAGRSEILETIVGARARATGEIRADGQPVGRGVKEALGKGLVLVAEDRKQQAILPARSVQENATLTLGGGLFRRRGQETSAALPWLERLKTKYASLEQPIAALSGGNQQKVLLARALVLAPRLLMLDEPTRGIDLGAKQRIYEEVIELARGGMGVLVASSELPELLALCHRVLVIREGRVVAELDQREMSEESIVIAATGATQHA